MFIWGPFTSVIGSYLKRILFHCIQIFFSFLIKPSFPFFLFCKSITISFVISGWKLAGGRVSDFSFSPFFNVLNLVHSPEILPSQSSLILSHLCWIGGHLYSRLKQGWGLASCSSKTLSMCQSWQEETVAPSASLWEASSYVYVWNHRVFQILESPMTEQVLPLTNWTRCFIAAVLMVFVCCRFYWHLTSRHPVFIVYLVGASRTCASIYPFHFWVWSLIMYSSTWILN